jgi:hypothetical protein
MQGSAGDPSPAMSPAEQALLRAAAGRATRMVEFGAGGSTLLLLEAGEGRLVTVENDPAWLARLAESPRCAAAAAEGRWAQVPVDQGPVGEWGWPLDAARRDDGATYVNAPWSEMPEPDFVLVDGRYRVACALAALSRMGPEGRVAVHDFWPRPHYRTLLESADLDAMAGSLVLLRPKPGLPRPTPQQLSDPR